MEVAMGTVKSDIEIAREATMLPIRDVAAQLGIQEEYLESYGRYKAKLSQKLWDQIKDRPDGKLVLVTAINPTPAGEGKTTTTVGLGQAMGKLGKKAIIALRIFPDCPHGRDQSPLYRRYPRCQYSTQPSFGDDR